MKLNNTSLIIGILLLLIGVFDCQYNPSPVYDKSPLIEDRFFWFCENDIMVNASCFSIIYQNGDIIQLNPKYEYIKNIGRRFGSFSLIDGTGNIFFTDKNIYEGQEYLASVSCITSDGDFLEFSANIIPIMQDLHFINYRLLWMKNKAPVFIILIVVFIILVFLIKISPRWFIYLILGGILILVIPYLLKLWGVV